MEVYFFSKYECDVKSFSNLNISNDYFFNKEKKTFVIALPLKKIERFCYIVPGLENVKCALHR